MAVDLRTVAKQRGTIRMTMCYLYLAPGPQLRRVDRLVLL
jgi:hypothetical protein